MNRYNPATVQSDFDHDGLGLFLIQKSADAVKWEHLGAKGNQLSISFQVPYQDVTQMEGGSELQVYASDDAQAPQQQYEIRLAQPDEAIHISRCLYRAYGYTYLVEDMYYPEKISKKIEDESLISAVAVSEEGEIVGHCSLDTRVAGVLMESGQAVINPLHRGRKLLEQMKRFLNDYAIDIGLIGICSEPVTNHTRSQKTSFKTGSFSCGLMLGYLPATLAFKKMDQQQEHNRRSCVYNFMPLKVVEAKTVSVCDAYRDLVAAIYAGCGRQVTIDTQLRQNSEQAASVHSVFLPTLNMGIITVNTIGRDTVEQIKQGLFQLTMRASAEMVYLNLPMEESAAAAVMSRARELGFVFCAVAMALDGGRDMLRMQYVNCVIDFDEIEVVGPTAERIYSFIKAELAELSELEMTHGQDDFCGE